MVIYEKLIEKGYAYQLCVAELPLEPRSIIRGNIRVKTLIIG